MRCRRTFGGDHKNVKSPSATSFHSNPSAWTAASLMAASSAGEECSTVLCSASLRTARAASVPFETRSARRKVRMRGVAWGKRSTRRVVAHCRRAEDSVSQALYGGRGGREAHRVEQRIPEKLLSLVAERALADPAAVSQRLHEELALRLDLVPERGFELPERDARALRLDAVEQLARRGPLVPRRRAAEAEPEAVTRGEDAVEPSWHDPERRLARGGRRRDAAGEQRGSERRLDRVAQEAARHLLGHSQPVLGDDDRRVCRLGHERRSAQRVREDVPREARLECPQAERPVVDAVLAHAREALLVGARVLEVDVDRREELEGRVANVLEALVVPAAGTRGGRERFVEEREVD